MNKNKDKGFSNPRKETRADDETVDEFLDRIHGINRVKYTAEYNPRFGRYGNRYEEDKKMNELEILQDGIKQHQKAIALLANAAAEKITRGLQ